MSGSSAQVCVAESARRQGTLLELRSNREIAQMRLAGQVVHEAHQRAAELVRPGVTTAELDAAIEQVFCRYDAEPLFKGVPGTKLPFPNVSCISVNEQVVHGIPSERILKEGDIVSIDTGCRLRGWCGDAAVTHGVGRIDEASRRLLDVTQEALNVAIHLLRSERWWSTVAIQLQQFVHQAGFSVVEACVGHGIGRQMHESPQVPNFDPRANPDWVDFEIRPGLVLAIEPMVNAGANDVVCLEDGWTLVTKDHSRSAHFEHTVAITPAGPEILTGPETDLATPVGQSGR